MARTALKVKTQKRQKALKKALTSGKKAHHSTKVYNRCKLCGRIGGFMRRFQMCRICFRENARAGKIMGIKKSSW
ncbi:MAG TPA: type Z 30S ribosomal protein S14 [Candidatus Gracilibacteria bacterium]|nr:type Z 30S ribosomal protein S14 [Candidatus Gracilibacteria bacterium]